MAAPSNGESGAYEARAEGAWATGNASGGAPFTILEYARGAGGLVPDAYGRPTATDLVARQGLAFFDTFYSSSGENREPDWLPIGSLDHFRPGTTDLIVSGGSLSGYEDQSYTPIPLLPAQTSHIDYNITYWFYGLLPSCLTTSLLQGASVPSSQWMAWGECELLGVVALNGTEAFVATGATSINGYEATELSWADEDVSVQFYVNPAFPVPLRAVVSVGQDKLAADLTGFQAGTGGGSAAAPDEGALPMAKAPRKPWGPDDTGSSLAFPPSLAWQKALDDPTTPAVRDYLDAHPDAYTFLTWSTGEMKSQQSTDRLWIFIVTDGPTALTFIVQQSVRQPPALPLPELLVTYQVTAQDVEENADLPTSDTLPAEVPTVVGMEERYGSFAGDSGQKPNSLFAVVGMGEGDDAFMGTIGWSDFDFSAMMMPDPSTLPALRYNSITVGDQMLTVDGAGKALYYFDMDFGFASTVESPVPSPSPGPLPPAETKDHHGLALAAILFAPTSPEAAGIGLVSLLAGALYWLWPTLKGALFGLFSRVQPPVLLEHPGRSRLVQIVQAEPGIHFQDLVRRSGLPNGTAVHHLGKLTQAGLLSARPLGRYTCYFPGASPDRAALAAAPVLRSDGARRVYEAIQGRPGLSGLELAGLVALQPSTVNYHVQRLVDCGLVRAARDGRSVRLSAVAAG
jgi:DNA-binding transcriptional ArsR family regulator